MTETRGATALPERGEPDRRSGGSLPARISLYYRQIIAEMRKVIWPTRKQLITYTSVVIVFVCVVIAFVSLLDFAFGKLVLWVFG